LLLTVTAAPPEPVAAEAEDPPDDEYGPDELDVDVCAAAGVAAELVLDVLAVFLLLPQALSATAAVRAAVTARCFATSSPVVRAIGCLPPTDARARATFPRGRLAQLAAQRTAPV
jgi:hypothetical protein